MLALFSNNETNQPPTHKGKYFPEYLEILNFGGNLISTNDLGTGHFWLILKDQMELLEYPYSK